MRRSWVGVFEWEGRKGKYLGGLCKNMVVVDVLVFPLIMKSAGALNDSVPDAKRRPLTSRSLRVEKLEVSNYRKKSNCDMIDETAPDFIRFVSVPGVTSIPRGLFLLPVYKFPLLLPQLTGNSTSLTSAQRKLHFAHNRVGFKNGIELCAVNFFLICPVLGRKTLPLISDYVLLLMQ